MRNAIHEIIALTWVTVSSVHLTPSSTVHFAFLLALQPYKGMVPVTLYATLKLSISIMGTA
jgi:hypothetical protein